MHCVLKKKQVPLRLRITFGGESIALKKHEKEH